MEKQTAIDWGSLVVAGILTALGQIIPQLQTVIVGPDNDPLRMAVYSLIMLGISQLGSYYAKKQVAEATVEPPAA